MRHKPACAKIGFDIPIQIYFVILDTGCITVIAWERRVWGMWQERLACRTKGN